jgi:hypothetical protein
MASDDAKAAEMRPVLALSAEEVAHLPPDDLLQVCLEYRQLLLTLKGILATPDTSLTLRVVAMDLVLTLAAHQTAPQLPQAREEVVWIKEVSERLGLQPKAVRAAYHRLEQRGAINITDIRFPRTHPGQASAPSDMPRDDAAST